MSTVAVKNTHYLPRHRVSLDSPQQATLVKSIEGRQHGTGVSLITTSIIGRWWIKEFYRVGKRRICSSDVTRSVRKGPSIVMVSQPITFDRGRAYVIGDIHGRSDLLDRMVNQIFRDLDANPVRDCVTVTIGDYIDRGPDSRGVLDRLAHNPFPTRFVALKGNHEALFETFLPHPSHRADGGQELRTSVKGTWKGGARGTPQVSRLAEDDDGWQVFPLPCGCATRHTPGTPSDEDLLWIRDEFLNSKVDFGKIIVHGHTPTKRAEVLPNRINIDTGAFALRGSHST